MAAKAELKAVLTLNNVQFLRNIKSAVSSAKAMAAQFARNPFQTTFVAGALATRKAVQVAARGVEFLASIAKVGFIAVGALGTVAAGTMLLLGKAAVDAAAKYEQFQVSFEVLLQSATKASARMKELTDFANTTPFRLDEVAAASRTLEVLSHGALSTGKGLRLVGDVAAGTLRPIDEMASTVGRLFDALRSGRAAGEPLMRLQEVGAITGGGRRQIESLSAAHLTSEAWAVARKELSRFDGLMGKQSKTWVGLMSTFKDSIEEALRQFGFPLLETLKPILDKATKQIFAWAPKANEFGKVFADGIQTGVNVIAAVFDNPAVLIGPFTDSLKAGVKGAGNIMIAAMKSAVAILASPAFFASMIEAWRGFGKVLGGILEEAFARPIANLRQFIPKTVGLADLRTQGEKDEERFRGQATDAFTRAQGEKDPAKKEKFLALWRKAEDLALGANKTYSETSIREGQALISKATDHLFEGLAKGINAFKVVDVLGAGSAWGKATGSIHKVAAAGAKSVGAFSGSHAGNEGKLFDVYRKPREHMTRFGGSLLNGFETRMLTPFVAGMLGSTGGLNKAAMRTTSILPLEERRQFENERVAELTAKGIKGSRKGTTGDAYGAVRQGDRARAREASKQILREKMGIDKTNEILKAIEAKFDKIQAMIV